MADDKAKEQEPEKAPEAPVAGAAGDADADDDGAVKKKKKKGAAVDDDAPAPAAGAESATAAVASSSGSGSGSGSGGSVEGQLRKEIDAIIKAGDITKLTVKEVRKLLTAPAGPFSKDVVSANKKLISDLLEAAVVSFMAANGMAPAEDMAAAATAASAASAEDSQAASQSQAQSAVGEEDAGDSDDDAAADDGGGSSDYEESSKKSKKSKSKKSSSDSPKKKPKKKRTTDSDGDDEPRGKKKAGSKRKAAGGGGDGPEPPKRGKSAFLFYSLATRASAKDENPDMSFGQLGKLLGDRWKALSDEQKKPYEEQAAADKKRYEAEKAEFDEANPHYESSRKSQKRLLDDDATGGGGSSSGSSSSRSTSVKPPDKNAPYYDHVLWQLKQDRRKKKDKHTDEELKSFAKNFINKMDRAFDDDAIALQNDQPGLRKLQLLPDVIANGSKIVLQESLRDAGILRAIGQWLNIYPDGSLPNQKLRTSLYDLLATIKVEETDLNNSQGLGKLIMRLWESKHETADNKKKLAALIEKWTRPMLGATTDYKKLAEVERKKFKDIVARKQSLGYKPVIPAPAVIKRAVIPDAATFDYALRPESKIDEEELEDRMPRKPGHGDESMRSRLAKKIDPRSLGRTKSGTQSATVDITGNHIN